MYNAYLKYKVYFLWIFVLWCVAACSDAPPKTYTIGFSQCTTADSWRKNMVEGMVRELSFYPEIKILILSRQSKSVFGNGFGFGVVAGVCASTRRSNFGHVGKK